MFGARSGNCMPLSVGNVVCVLPSSLCRPVSCTLISRLDKSTSSEMTAENKLDIHQEQSKPKETQLCPTGRREFEGQMGTTWGSVAPSGHVEMLLSLFWLLTLQSIGKGVLLTKTILTFCLNVLIIVWSRNSSVKNEHCHYLFTLMLFQTQKNLC